MNGDSRNEVEKEKDGRMSVGDRIKVGMILKVNMSKMRNGWNSRKL